MPFTVQQTWAARPFDVRGCRESIIQFAGPLPARVALQVSRCFAFDPECRNVAQHGELVISGEALRDGNTGWIDFFPWEKYDS